MSKENNHLISVLIPAYNHERYVQESIKSIINQTYENLELIVVNDGSTDSTHEKILELDEFCRKRFCKYIYINKHNEGVIKTWNKAFSLAKGKYIFCTASDDVSESEAIETLHNFLSENPDYAFAVGGNSIIDENGNICFWNEKRDNVYDKADATYTSFDDALRKWRPDIDFNTQEFGSYRSLLKGNYIPNGFLIDRKIVENIGGFSEQSPLEDAYLLLQIAKQKKLKYIDRPLFRYRWHGSNTITDGVRQAWRKTFMNERGYCLRNGHFFLWLRLAYEFDWPNRWERLRKRLRIAWLFEPK